MRKKYQEKGDSGSLDKARLMVEGDARLSLADRERLLSHLEGTGRTILVEPQVLLTPTPKLPGLDGRKMSKSYGNTIAMREEPDEVARKLKAMPTDPARVRRTDPGDPDKCPVFDLHRLYTPEDTRARLTEGCKTAGIGCIECKKPLIDAVVSEITAFRDRAREFEDSPDLIRNVVREGCEKARDAARRTMAEVTEAVGMDYL